MGSETEDMMIDQADPVEEHELRRANRECPYRNLWLAVLHRALADAVDPRSTGGGDTPATQQYYARQWFRSQAYEPGSLRWIVDELEITAGEIAHIMRQVATAKRIPHPRRYRCRFPDAR